MTKTRKRPHPLITNTRPTTRQLTVYPEHICRHADTLTYYLESADTAKQFIDEIAINSNLRATREQTIGTPWQHYFNSQSCYTVSLTETECDQVLGQGSFRFLQSRGDGAYLQNLAEKDSEVIHHVFLLMEEDNRRLCHRLLLRDSIATYFCRLGGIGKLSPEFCTHLAFVLQKSGLLYHRPSDALYDHAHASYYQQPLVEFIEKLDTNTCNTLATMAWPEKVQWTYLHAISCYPAPLFSLFMSKLTPDIRKQTMQLTYQGMTPMSYMLSNQPQTALRPYLVELYSAGHTPQAILTGLLRKTFFDSDNNFNPTHLSRLSNNIMALVDDMTESTFQHLLESTHLYHCIDPDNSEVDYTFLGAVLNYSINSDAILNRISPNQLNKLATRPLPTGSSFTIGIEEIVSVISIYRIVDRLKKSLTHETWQTIALTKSKRGNALLIELVHGGDLDWYIGQLTSDTLNRLLSFSYKGETIYEYLQNKISTKSLERIHTNITPETASQLIFATVFGQPLRESPLLMEPKRLHVSSPHPLKLLGTALQHPGVIKQQASHLSQLFYLAIYDSGISVSRWSTLTGYLLNQIPIFEKESYRHITFKHHRLSEFYSSYPPARYARMTTSLVTLARTGWKLLRIQGRTLLLQKANQDILAIKIRKDNEPVEALVKEQQTTAFLRHLNTQGRLHLQSELPKPNDIIVISDLFTYLADAVSVEEQQALLKMIGNKNTYTAYTYETDIKSQGYFTYLHDAALTDGEFTKANQVAVHDLLILLQQGIAFPQLADIFHNTEHKEERQDRGRYMVLVDILRPRLGRMGSGRITAWQQAVQYPNLRQTGLADLGDSVSLKDLFESPHFSEVLAFRGEYYILANQMAEYQYVLFLIAGRRGVALTQLAFEAGQSPAEIHQIWKALAAQVFQNVVQATVMLTKQAEHKITTLLSAIVDIDRLATQMHYWMTTDYVDDVKNDRIPPDIYGQGTTVDIQFKRFRAGTYHPTLGFAINGKDPDLGPVNGQEPIKEANKLFYWMVNYIVYAYLELALTLKDLRAITNDKQIASSEVRRHNAFFHLPEKNYHALQAALCEERLKQHSTPSDLKAKLQNEAKQHRETHAAITLQQFWRNKKASQTELPAELTRLRSGMKRTYC